MTLPDFVSGCNTMSRLVAEEKLMEGQIALLGGMVKEEYISSTMERFMQMTKSEKELKQMEKLKEARNKWSERGVDIQ